MIDSLNLLEIYLQEYQTLKAEQTARIGFRDNLLYVTIAVFGGILSFTLANKNYYALLIVPWVCLILGWTYLVNDEKISALSRYMRYDLTERIAKLTNQSTIDGIFGWEIAHRSDLNRKRRKIQQLIIDQLTFVLSGIISLIAFWILIPKISISLWILSIVELLLILVLGIEIIIYSDLAKG
ncbi:hypothetical protein [Leptothoe sp. PORK10 BA2]|uniref:hypothetical protein n=1 Tax=Leptothoe sp. PORK10 BA2 TaxID=3110254 RepID=UPI002B216817|nr:hypothetical protein [Leptothoe sp. PORK10 BA2]MEA5464406.1 hypothetical protein [Leptothoe sp. PORK10 BA2]